MTTLKGGTLNCMNNKGVCTETPVGPFDIDEASAPVFPDLDESPATEFCADPTTWRTCIRDEAAADGVTISTSGGVLDLVVPSSLPTACLNFLTSAAASSSKQLVFDGANVDCRYTDTSTGRTYGFNYVATTPARFDTFGNINLRGFDVLFNRSTQYEASHAHRQEQRHPLPASIETRGGTGGNFQANASFTTTSANAFPANVLTVVAEVDANLRGGNNTFFTIPVYAGEVFRMTSSSILFGQVIANQFCTTNPGGSSSSCATAGSPAEIVFVPTGENRARSFRAIAPTGGLPTFTTVAYELR